MADIDHTRAEFHIAGRRLHDAALPTDQGKARFHAVGLPALPPVRERQARLMTVRSEGQFNTVVYEDEDVYRGQERRDVILMNPQDMQRLGLVAESARDGAQLRGRNAQAARAAVRRSSGQRADVLPRGERAGAARCRSAFQDAGVQVRARGYRARVMAAARAESS